MSKKSALITGITGQDGAYLAEFLLQKGYEVHGIKRRASLFNTVRIDHLYQDPHDSGRRMILHYGDLTDSTAAKPEEFPAKVREYQYMVEQLKARGVPEKDIPTFEQYGSSNGIALTMPDGSHLTIGGSGKGSGSASLPPEMGARIGLGERYLTTDYPDILPDIKDGSATGPIDYISGYFGRGKSGDVQRRMASGVDALRRNLTGAGMAASEADDYARRYLPQW